MKGQLFSGKRVLIMEDEPVIAILLEELIEAAGGKPIAISYPSSFDAVMAQGVPDLAILDINTHDGTSFGIARLLQENGVPFVFASGYGRQVAPGELARVPTLTKPYGLEDLEQALGAAISLLGGAP